MYSSDCTELSKEVQLPSTQDHMSWMTGILLILVYNCHSCEVIPSLLVELNKTNLIVF